MLIKALFFFFFPLLDHDYRQSLVYIKSPLRVFWESACLPPTPVSPLGWGRGRTAPRHLARLGARMSSPNVQPAPRNMAEPRGQAVGRPQDSLYHLLGFSLF